MSEDIKDMEQDEPRQQTITDDENRKDMNCGLTAACQPKWLQKCASAKSFLLVLTIFGIVQGFVVNGIHSVNISAYERRYLLSSKSSSLVGAFYDISAGILVLLVGYFGAVAHQPRLLAFGALLLGVGTFVMTIAQFASPPYNPGINEGYTVTCNLHNNVTVSESPAYLKNYMYLLLLGQALNGFTGASLFTLGITYIDQSCTTEVTSWFIGIFAGGTVLGPAIGYLIGGSFLNIYVDFPKNPPNGLTRDDPAWVGAWWIPFILSSVLSFILAFFLFLFPRELPGSAAIQAAKVSQAHDNGIEHKIKSKPGFGIGWRGIPKATLYLLRTPSYVCLCIADGLELFIIIGVSTFLPKVISNQFAQSLDWSSKLTGLLAVPAGAAAQILGGYVIKRWNLSLSQILKLTLVSLALSLLLCPLFLARCEDSPIAGVLAPYPGQALPDEVDLNSTCNSECGCSTSTYEPVCADGIQYFSPCHAGCSLQPVELENKTQVYHNCSCLLGLNASEAVVAVKAKCKLNCKLLYTLFTPLAFLQMFFIFFAGTPMSVATLRVLPDKLKAYGLSVSQVFLRLLGSIPGPIIFGAILDASCKVWQTDPDGETRGSCWIYDNAGMAVRIVVLFAVVKTLSLLFSALALWLYKAPQQTQ